MMLRVIVVVIAILIPFEAQADRLYPKDLRALLTFVPADYSPDEGEWTRVVGDGLKTFLGYRWLGGMYIEDKPILSQGKPQPLLLGVAGDRFTSQAESEDRPDRGELSIMDSQYCVWWKGYGKLCYRVLTRMRNDQTIYLITRANGKPWAGIEILRN